MNVMGVSLRKEREMSSIKYKYFMLKNEFDGYPKLGDFELCDGMLPSVNNGEFLVECLYLSVDPYMRASLKWLKIGSKMIGEGVAKIIESKNVDFPVGSIVAGPFGWCTHAIGDKSGIEKKQYRLLPDNIGNPSYGIGVYGMPGITAYFGLLEICQPKPKETVFVTGAAGCVGSIVGQIAKIKGCRVVGCAGSDAEVKLSKEIGFDAVFNNKITNFKNELKKYCPNGIDCFYDNVGGDSFQAIMKQMNKCGRVSLCGSIATYNNKPPYSNDLSDDEEDDKNFGPMVHLAAIPKELKIQGFLASTYLNTSYKEGFGNLKQWVDEGKLKVKEQVFDGFEKMPEAFLSLFTGHNIGNTIVKINVNTSGNGGKRHSVWH